MSEQEPVAFSREDKLAVGLGFLILLLSTCIGAVPMPSYGWSTFSDWGTKLFGPENAWRLANGSMLGLAVLLFAHIMLGGKSIRPVLARTLILVAVSQLALLLAGNGWIKSYNLEAVIFSLAGGLLVRHLAGPRPGWDLHAPSEFLVKTGLVLLGSGVIFSDILKAGSLGLIQALVVVVAVWYVAFRICRRLRIDEEMSMMLSSAVSICGVSAAIATAGAIKGDPKKLSFVVAVVLVTAIPMIIGMPWLAQVLELSPAVTGAWLGGTIDTSGAVVAAGSLSGEKALQISTIVKFSQNVLLGLAALAIGVYWSYRNTDDKDAEKPTARIIWIRFPKFVLGFMAASALFSFILSPETVALAKDGLKGIQNQFFVLAFTAIGMETRLPEILNRSQRPALAAFLLAQAFNIVFTLGIAWFLFSRYAAGN